jgi:riboflavin synthase
VHPLAGGARLELEAGAVLEDARVGDSIAVNGCCLTVVERGDGWFAADAVTETLERTTLGGLVAGDPVNLERPLRADARVGGHFVQGHVDGTAAIEDVREEGGSYWVTIKFPPALASYIVRKGSIAVDGISLTVAGVDAQRFDVQVIPYTWQHTTLQRHKQGDLVNLECDILGKYVVRATELAAAAKKIH